jgi:hypothetical protein
VGVVVVGVVVVVVWALFATSHVRLFAPWGGGEWGRHKLFVANARARVEWVSGPSPWSSFYETYIYIYLSIYTVCLI